METWLQVELAATEAWAMEGVVLAEAAKERRKASFTVEEVEERERTTATTSPRSSTSSRRPSASTGAGSTTG